MAFELLGAAESLRTTIGSPRGAALDAELTERLASARSGLGDVAADAAVEQGRLMDLDAALDLAVAICASRSNGQTRDRTIDASM